MIILVDDGEIISDNTKIADMVLDIPEISLSKKSGTANRINDPVDNIIQTFDNHPSILRILVKWNCSLLTM